MNRLLLPMNLPEGIRAQRLHSTGRLSGDAGGLRSARHGGRRRPSAAHGMRADGNARQAEAQPRLLRWYGVRSFRRNPLHRRLARNLANAAQTLQPKFPCPAGPLRLADGLTTPLLIPSPARLDAPAARGPQA